MHKITHDLQQFYDAAADSFSQTRKRHRPEFAYILAYIKTHFATRIGKEDTLHITELGCGDGRFLGYIQEHLSCKIVYTGVDISYNLLAIANETYPDATRVHKDMSAYLQDTPQESVDCIVAIASFHHLPTSRERSSVLEYMYQSLTYNGCFIMTNWCYSDWFVKKYHKEKRQARILAFFTAGRKDKDDIMIPWKNVQGTVLAKRLYHIFSLGELGKLITQAGFTDLKNIYITHDGKTTMHESDGRNLISSGVKSIYRERN